MQYALVPLAVFTSPFRSMWEEWTGSHQVNMTDMPCGASNYTTEIVSLDPLAIYINGFMSNWEITHLRELAWVKTHLEKQNNTDILAMGLGTANRRLCITKINTPTKRITRLAA